MSETTPPLETPRTPASGGPGGGARSEWATGGTVFAGVLMLVNGVLGIVQGIAGVADDDVYTSVGDYVFEFSTASWGWIHIILGGVLALVGWGILAGSEAARGFGVAIACLSVVLNFLWLPYVPI